MEEFNEFYRIFLMTSGSLLLVGISVYFVQRWRLYRIRKQLESDILKRWQRSADNHKALEDKWKKQ